MLVDERTSPCSYQATENCANPPQGRPELNRRDPPLDASQAILQRRPARSDHELRVGVPQASRDRHSRAPRHAGRTSHAPWLQRAQENEARLRKQLS